MTQYPGSQTIVIHILSNISRNKGSQTMRFGQLIECYMRNVFLEKPSQNVMEKLDQDIFLKN